MNTTTTVGLSSFIMLALAAFTTEKGPTIRPAAAEASFYLAEMHGDLHASPRGTATFGWVGGGAGAPAVFTLSLGGDSANGSVLFTRMNGARLVPGTYIISGRDDGSDELRVLVMTGTASKPTGVFRGQSGYLIVTSATDHVIEGRFQVDAKGFLASNPADESRPMQATAMFTATRD
jgi:hypothetical protein